MPEIAIAMTGQWSDDDFSFGHQTSTSQEIRIPPYTMRELKPGLFRRYFKQKMYLYLVPTSHFEVNEQLQDFEVLSYEDVPVHGMIEVDDPLDYLQNSPLIQLKRFV